MSFIYYQKYASSVRKYFNFNIIKCIELNRLTKLNKNIYKKKRLHLFLFRFNWFLYKDRLRIFFYTFENKAMILEINYKLKPFWSKQVCKLSTLYTMKTFFLMIYNTHCAHSVMLVIVGRKLWYQVRDEATCISQRKGMNLTILPAGMDK